jgi:hypothetical protein
MCHKATIGTRKAVTSAITGTYDPRTRMYTQPGAGQTWKDSFQSIVFSIDRRPGVARRRRPFASVARRHGVLDASAIPAARVVTSASSRTVGPAHPPRPEPVPRPRRLGNARASTRGRTVARDLGTRHGRCSPRERTVDHRTPRPGAAVDSPCRGVNRCRRLIGGRPASGRLRPRPRDGRARPTGRWDFPPVMVSSRGSGTQVLCRTRGACYTVRACSWFPLLHA